MNTHTGSTLGDFSPPTSYPDEEEGNSRRQICPMIVVLKAHPSKYWMKKTQREK